jgi:ribose-phosphate pyrophosphokinase
MPNGKGPMMIFSGSSNLELGHAVANHLNFELGDVKIERFSNGEIYVRFQESVRGAEIFLIQSVCDPVNDNLMELLIMIDALKRASADVISAVIPHYGYARQDKKSTAREPITAKLVADLLQAAGVDRVITMDLHQGQIQGFFDRPVDHLTALPILASHFEELEIRDNLVVVSPDVGRVKVAKRFADMLGAGLAIMHKGRPEHNVAEITHVIGRVAGKNCVMIDDMIDTAGTLCAGAETLMTHEAAAVYACATHPILSGPAVERIQASPIKEVLVTDTIPVPPEKTADKITVLSVAPLFAHAILNVYEDQSVSELFDPDFLL